MGPKASFEYVFSGGSSPEAQRTLSIVLLPKAYLGSGLRFYGFSSAMRIFFCATFKALRIALSCSRT